MLHIMHTSILGAAVLGAAAVTVTSAAPVPRDASGDPYFATEVGAKWVYESGGIETVEVVTDVQSNDGVVVVTVGEEARGIVLPRRTVSWSSDGLRLVNEESYIYEPPLLLLRTPVKAGDKWETNSVWRGLGPFVFKDSRTVIRTEKVEVPAGTFEAVRIESEYAFQSVTGKGTYWYVRGLGPVKTEFGDTGRVLKSFSRGDSR